MANFGFRMINLKKPNIKLEIITLKLIYKNVKKTERFLKVKNYY